MSLLCPLFVDQDCVFIVRANTQVSDKCVHRGRSQDKKTLNLLSLDVASMSSACCPRLCIHCFIARCMAVAESDANWYKLETGKHSLHVQLKEVDNRHGLVNAQLG